MAKKAAPIVVDEDPEPINDPKALDVLRTLYERDGKLTPDTVLVEAQDPASPLHRRFEWDDAVAAHEYRRQQARQLIRVVMTTIQDTKVRAFVHIRSASTYAPVEEAMSRPDWRDEILRDFERDADRFKAKWSMHRHVADAYKAWIEKEAAA